MDITQFPQKGELITPPCVGKGDSGSDYILKTQEEKMYQSPGTEANLFLASSLSDPRLWV